MFDIRKLYLFAKVHPLGAQLTMSHYRLLFPLRDDNEIDYYINQIVKRNLSKRELEAIIKSNEYERLPEATRTKMICEEKLEVKDLVSNPILIRNKNNIEIVTEKALHHLILEDIESFMKELGNSFGFIGSEYKIKIGDRNYFIDLLLFNIKYNCYVVVELKVLLFNLIDRSFYILPGGKINELEESIDAIKREVKEELGWENLEYKFLGISKELVNDKGYNNHQINLIYKGIYKNKKMNEVKIF